MPFDSKPNPHPHFFFDTVDRVTIDGVAYIPTMRNSEGYVFQRADSTGVAEGFSNERLALLVREQRLSVETSYYLPQTAAVNLSGPAGSITLLSGAHETRVRMRNALVEAFLEMEKGNQIVRTDASIEANHASLCNRAAEFYARQAVLATDKTREQPKKFSARSLRRWLKEFEAFGIGGNTDNYAKSGNREGNTLSEARVLLAQQVRGYLCRDQPTIKTIALKTGAAFSAENKIRAEKGLPPLSVPSRNAISEAIKRLDPFTVAVKRYGQEEAMRRMRLIGQGMYALSRPMQRVEMDESCIDLISVFKEGDALRAVIARYCEIAGLERPTEPDLVPRLIHACRGRFGVCIEKTIEAIEFAMKEGATRLSLLNYSEAWSATGTRPQEQNAFANPQWASIDLSTRNTRPTGKRTK